MHISSAVGILLVFIAQRSYGQSYIQPEQVHLSFGINENEFTITWTTFDKVNASIVEYGSSDENLDNRIVGSSTKFVDSGSKQRSIYIHRVAVTLTHRNRFYYRCGSPNHGWSTVYHFTPPAASEAWIPTTVAFFGDMGNAGAVSLPFLQTEVQRKQIDAVIHVGDMAYNLEDQDAKTGDEFVRQLVPIAAHVPYMTVPGNHERAYNFSNYKARFSMPTPIQDSMFYSFNLGPVHFIALNTENYFYPEFGLETLQTQYNWLLQDLSEANLPQNRKQRPWIVVYGHRPLYCSNKGADDCNSDDSVMRLGDSKSKVCGFEKLFLDAGVDVYLSGHKHTYERLLPLYNNKVRNGTLVYGQPYNNPNATVYIVSGLAGSGNEKGSFSSTQPAWSAFRALSYGYSTMKIFNGTHINFKQHSVEQNEAEVIDEMWLVKSQPYPPFYKELSKIAPPLLINGCLAF